MGNRGILHDDAGRVVRNHASSLWITCALSFKGWRAEQWQPHHYTVLFFHDEAVSLAAGTARVHSVGGGVRRISECAGGTRPRETVASQGD